MNPVTSRPQRSRPGSTMPLVYSCSGCSSAAQTTNTIALALDRRGVAEMSCIAGVGGDVPSLVRLARSGRPVVAIDGCPLECARSCLARQGVVPAVHVVLSDHGVRKRRHADADPDEAARIAEQLAVEIAGRWPVAVAT
ncbi:MAG TPA: putative zinc-binding protein [Egicoccus sp.]|nr:putative zinc-binding protein [Egicoccus sp.]HSK23181.1 putative zinc-binding protein [Egicoccus sp.]